MTGPLPPSHFSGSGQSGGITAVARSPCHGVAGGCPVIAVKHQGLAAQTFPAGCSPGTSLSLAPFVPSRTHGAVLENAGVWDGVDGGMCSKTWKILKSTDQSFPVSTLDEWSVLWICQTPRWPPILVKECLDFWKLCPYCKTVIWIGIPIIFVSRKHMPSWHMHF